MIALLCAFGAGFTCCAAIAVALWRSSDDDEPTPPNEDGEK
jgi:hypothetical protein